MKNCKNCGEAFPAPVTLEADNEMAQNYCDKCRRMWNKGFMEGESKQAILEVQGRDRFMDDLRSGALKMNPPKDCPKILGEVVKHNGRTVSAAYQLGQTMYHDPDLLIEKLSSTVADLRKTMQELTKTLNELTRK